MLFNEDGIFNDTTLGKIEQMTDEIEAIPGIKAVEDDMPFGQQQLVIDVNPLGQSLGLSVQEVGRQLRGAFDGELAQIFNEGDDEIEVRVMLPDSERYRLTALDDFGVLGFVPGRDHGIFHRHEILVRGRHLDRAVVDGREMALERLVMILAS